MLAHRNIAAIEIAGSKRLATAVFAVTLGTFFIYFAAFSNAALLHNAAHDTRHAIATPCH